jgi:hypothetical protein
MVIVDCEVAAIINSALGWSSLPGASLFVKISHDVLLDDKIPGSCDVKSFSSTVSLLIVMMCL